MESLTLICLAFLLTNTCRATENVSPTHVTLEPETYRRIVHRGFKEGIFPEERIVPEEITGSESTSSRSHYSSLSIAQPYPETSPDCIPIAETIVHGVNIVSRDLIRRRQIAGENSDINVYFTGQSYIPLL